MHIALLLQFDPENRTPFFGERQIFRPPKSWAPGRHGKAEVFAHPGGAGAAFSGIVFGGDLHPRQNI